MSKMAVIYWSMTGNTQAMAEAIADGAREAGAQADLFSVDQVTVDQALEYDKLALGCPAMGAEATASGCGTGRPAPTEPTPWSIRTRA